MAADTPYDRLDAAMHEAGINERSHVKVNCADAYKFTTAFDAANRIVKGYRHYTRPLSDPEKDLRDAMRAICGEQP